MRILYIVNMRMPTEKAHGVAIANMCEVFAKAGADVTLVVPRRKNVLTHTVGEFYGLKEPLRVVYLPTLDFFVAERYIGRIAFFVQAATFYLSAYFWALFRSKDSVVYTTDAACAPLSLLGFRLYFECHAVPGRRGVFFFLAKFATGIIAVSETIAARFTPSKFADIPILVAQNGVDLGIFDVDLSMVKAREKLSLPPPAYIVMYTGNFTTYGEEKGIDTCIRAMKYLAQDIFFVAVGGGENDRQRYEARARQEGVASHVILRGHMSQRELAIYQKAADVLLMPFPDTPHYRGNMSPMKMFEYMASKRPIIASDLPAIKEVLDGRSALFVAPDSPEALSDAMGRLQKNTVLGASLAGTAYEKVSMNYTWGARAARVLHFMAR